MAEIVLSCLVGLLLLIPSMEGFLLATGLAGLGFFKRGKKAA